LLSTFPTLRNTLHSPFRMEASTPLIGSDSDLCGRTGVKRAVRPLARGRGPQIGACLPVTRTEQNRAESAPANTGENRRTGLLVTRRGGESQRHQRSSLGRSFSVSLTNHHPSAVLPKTLPTPISSLHHHLRHTAHGPNQFLYLVPPPTMAISSPLPGQYPIHPTTPLSVSQRVSQSHRVKRQDRQTMGQTHLVSSEIRLWHCSGLVRFRVIGWKRRIQNSRSKGGLCSIITRDITYV
jgi:hypothetical protein